MLFLQGPFGSQSIPYFNKCPQGVLLLKHWNSKARWLWIGLLGQIVRGLELAEQPAPDWIQIAVQFESRTSP